MPEFLVTLLFVLIFLLNQYQIYLLTREVERLEKYKNQTLVPFHPNCRHSLQPFSHDNIAEIIRDADDRELWG